MCRPLFLRISEAIQGYDAYFTHRADALGKLGLHPVVKITEALRMLAYGAAGDCNNKYLQISKTMSLKSMDLFCNAIVALYESEYLCEPTPEDLEQLLKI